MARAPYIIKNSLATSSWLVHSLLDVSRYFLLALFCKLNLQVNTNGVLSFRSSFLGTDPVSFPLLSSDILIAPFWDTFDIGQGGQILFRHTNDATILTQVDAAINDAEFSAALAFIVTWDSVPGFLTANTVNIL